MSIKKKMFGLLTAVALTVSAVPAVLNTSQQVTAAEDVTNTMDWDAVEIGGGGFVSGIVTGKEAMYARTDVGGAYKYNYETDRWEQLLAFINEEDRGYLSVDAMCIDPTDDDTAYFLVGCAYFSSERTAILKTTDGGKTFTEHEVTDLIKVHGNGYGRQCGEAIAVDPDNTDVIYCGGDTDGLIMSTDAGETWSYVDSFNDLGLFQYEVKWPTWTETIEKTTVGTDYSNSNGIATIAIEDGRVYVGVSDNTLKDSSDNPMANVYVADVGKDNWEPLSEDLPKDSFPSRINKDADGNLLISYIGGLTFNSTGGGIYKYDALADKVTNISPTENSFGGCVSLPDDSNTLIATTCGVWSGQSWDKDTTCYGEYLYRSFDGGETWEDIYPGKRDGIWVWDEELGEMHDNVKYGYLQDGGRSWIYGKAIHWSGTIVLNPTDPTQALVVSGNGVFNWNNIFTESPEAVFHPDGIEEVVALDMISIPGGNAFSAIGDYDGFEHADVTVSGKQHRPTMGSTGAIAYCPQNPDVMIRIAENQNDTAPGFYTLDGGETWTKMANSPGGKAAITQLEDGSYRFFNGSSDSGNISYSDDLGQTWKECTGISSAYGSKPTYMLVEPDKPNVVYAYVTYYNSSWFYSKSEPDFSDAHYTLCVSTDYGKTFTSTDIAMYDQCDSAGRIAYLGEDNLILGAGYYGMYNVTNGGKTVTKLDSVFYCKTVGYGAPEKAGDVNTLYMYGKPQETDPEGIYRSQDSGKTWVLINKDKLYGGTGNGNFLVGDMNEFGKVYMSTVGCGIVYGEISDSPRPEVTTAASTTSAPTTTTTVKTTAVTTAEPETEAPTPAETTEPVTEDIPDGTMYGDVNLDDSVNSADVVKLNLYLLNTSENKFFPDDEAKDSQAKANADCMRDNVIAPSDSSILMNAVLESIPLSELGK